MNSIKIKNNIDDLNSAAEEYRHFIKRIAYGWPGLDKLHDFVNADFRVAVTPARITVIEIESRIRDDVHSDDRDGHGGGSHGPRNVVDPVIHICENQGPQELAATLRRQATSSQCHHDEEHPSSASAGQNANCPGQEPYHCRLFLVENLCPRIICLLGGAFDVDPQFFADHINNTSWHRIDEIPERLQALPSVQRNESHLQLRYIEARTLLATRPSCSSSSDSTLRGDDVEMQCTHDHTAHHDDDDAASFIYPDERTTRVLRKAGKLQPRVRAGKSYDRLIMTRQPVTIWVRENETGPQGWVGKSSFSIACCRCCLDHRTSSMMPSH